MAKKITRIKRKRLKLQGVFGLAFTIALFAYIASSIFLRAYNVQLTVQIQSVRNEIVLLEQSNEVLSVEIQSLSSKERVMAIALDAGLSVNQENIVMINKGE
jgi:cell division protein FtsL